MESGKGAMGHEDETFEEFTARYDRFRTEGGGTKPAEAKPSGGFFRARAGGKLL